MQERNGAAPRYFKSYYSDPWRGRVWNQSAGTWGCIKMNPTAPDGGEGKGRSLIFYRCNLLFYKAISDVLGISYVCSR